MVRLEVKRTYFLLDSSKQILPWDPSAKAYLPRTHLLTKHNASSSQSCRYRLIVVTIPTSEVAGNCLCEPDR